MHGIALSVVLQAAMLATGAEGYEEAYAKATEQGQPLVVLVGADWCPGCQVMKHGVLAKLRERGRLKRVNYTTVNMDENSELAQKLMHGGKIPQLIVFTKTDEGWKREQVVGATSEENVESMIDRALAISLRKPSIEVEDFIIR